MPVTIDVEELMVIAHIQGEIDHHNVSEMRREIDLAAERYRPEKLVLDFGEVTFMDSSGIGLVMGRYKTIKGYGGKISIANTSSQIKKVMKLAGLDHLADIE